MPIHPKKPSHKISLFWIRTLAIGTILVLLSGWTGWYLGAHNITSARQAIRQITRGSSLSGLTNAPVDRSQPLDKNADMSLFWEVWDRLEQGYLFKENIDHNKMIYGAIEGMTAALGDPYTAFYPPQQNQTSKENLNGSFEGVGIELGYKTGEQLVVMSPLSGMPAEKAGVKAGDLILKITDQQKGVDKDTYGMTTMDAVELIRGQGGTKVKLTLMHEGASEPYEVELTRQTIVVPSVEVAFGQPIEGNFATDKQATGSGKVVAHLKLSRFGELTDEQWDQAVEKILAQKNNLGGVVLDVRNNPGGYMQGAINLAAEFLPVGKIVVKQESSQEATKEFGVQRYGRLQNVPLVVLMNKGSASASEILAGALRDNNRAKLIGDTSFGKGTIQAAQDLTGGAGLHMTIAKWLTPNGTWVHGKGLEPDVKVDVDKDNSSHDTQLVRAAEEVLKQAK